MKKVWEKANLPKSDAQQPSYGSNATCNLRLSQAGYKKNGNKIDQTKYFRDEVFDKCDWEKTQNGEVTSIDCELVIDGKNEGDYKLKVTHELHRESNQDNVTTILHWEDAIPALTKQDITGKTLELVDKEDGTYRIDIK